MTTLPIPQFERSNLSLQQAFQEVWYLKLNDPSQSRALWIRFAALSSGNGFKKTAEVSAIYFQRLPSREIKKTALKQSFDLSALNITDQPSLQIGQAELTESGTRGRIQSKAQELKWDFSFSSALPSSFQLVPELLSRTGISKSSISTVCEDLLFTGTTEINGEVSQWNSAPGMQGHLRGSKSGHSWVWGHCNTFVNEQGKLAPVIFEGLSARSQIGPFVTPRVSTFFFYYQGKSYSFNTLRDAFSIKSKNGINEWEFQADRDEISFRGHIRAEHKDFVGMTMEDTNGSLIYSSNSKLSDMKLLVYRNGNLEATFHAHGTAAIEVNSREKNPYITYMI